MTDTAEPGTAGDTADDRFDPEAFQKWLAEYPKGLLGFQLSEGLAKIIEATQLYDKSSAMSLKISVSPGTGFEGQLNVTADVSVSPAKPKPPTATFFPTAAGGLSRRDPNQPQLPGTENQ